MCHITSQVWGFLFERNKHPSGTSCQIPAQAFVCVFWSMTCKLLHQNTALFLKHLRKVSVECRTNFRNSNLYKCIGEFINMCISHVKKLASTTSSLEKLMKTSCIQYGGNCRSLWLSSGTRTFEFNIQTFKHDRFSQCCRFCWSSMLGARGGGEKAEES